MSRFGQPRSLIGAMLLFLSASACSRPTPAVPTEGPSQTGQTPFQDQGKGPVEDNPETVALIEKANSEPSLPFQTSQVLPGGSLLTVRLKSPITADKEGVYQTFKAVIDEPVVFEGTTLIPRGTIASGRVGVAHVSKEKPSRGYVSLVLESVNLDGLDLPVQTATLFARQIPSENSSGTVRLEKGHRLTFRLTEPFYSGVDHPQTSH
jgi:hypothetical protein